MNGMLMGVLVVSIILLTLCLIVGYYTKKIFKDYDKERDVMDESYDGDRGTKN